MLYPLSVLFAEDDRQIILATTNALNVELVASDVGQECTSLLRGDTSLGAGILGIVYIDPSPLRY